MSDLNARQERFVSAYVQGRTAADAAAAAGYSPRSAASTGSKLLAEPAVRAEIDRRQSEVAREVAISTKSLLAEVEAARVVAEANENASAMIAASQLKARLTGLIVDKPDPDAQREAAELAKQLEQSTAATMWADAAQSLGLPRDAKPEQIIGSAARTAVWPPSVFRLAHIAARQAAAERASEPAPAAEEVAA